MEARNLRSSANPDLFSNTLRSGSSVTPSPPPGIITEMPPAALLSPAVSVIFRQRSTATKRRPTCFARKWRLQTRGHAQFGSRRSIDRPSSRPHLRNKCSTFHVAALQQLPDIERVLSALTNINRRPSKISQIKDEIQVNLLSAWR